MSSYIEEKNIPALIIYTVLIAVGILAGISSWNSYQTNQKMDYLLSLVNEPQEQQQAQQQPDEFNGLSKDALSYYDQLGERVTGTPTWLIAGQKYKGFDVNNNIVPGFKGNLLNSKVILFSSPTCGYCHKAEEWLIEQGIEHTKVCAPIHKGDLQKCEDDKTFIV